MHQAQTKGRAHDQAQRRMTLRERIDVILATMLRPDQEVARRDGARQLGYNADYRHTFPDLAADMQRILPHHTAQVRERGAAAMAARVQQRCAALPHRHERVTVAHCLEQLDISWKCLREHYPGLAACVQQAVREHQCHEREAHRAEQLAQIDAAAQRLSARGIRLSNKAILAEANLSPHSDRAAVLQQRLQQWVGSFPWNE